jgi:DNA-directed RNA polymerase specialized sigma24 family protein
MESEKLRRKKEYYFRQYFHQNDIIKKRREKIVELDIIKKRIIDNPIFINAIRYDDMPKNLNTNPDNILDGIIKTDEKIEDINNSIMREIELLSEELKIFEKIEEVLKTLDDTYLQIFTLTYRDKMSNKEIAYILDKSDRTIRNARRYIFNKTDFIQED